MSSKQTNNSTKLPVAQKVDEGRTRSVLVVPSRVTSRPDEIDAGEETEIAAQITVPQEGGWGWVVVFASFWSIFILDGVAYTFGSIFKDITEDLQMQESFVALINSLAVALYFSTGPFTSALINRYGFRAVTMTGSVVVCFALFCTYFSTSYGALCLFYGCTAGVGYCFINMSSALVVGFYFEKLRSLAISISTTGSSLGIMIMFPLNTYLVQLAGWRTLTLLHCGLFGLVFFLGMTYRPLISLTVTKTIDSADPTRTVTYLPNLSSPSRIRATPSRTKAEGLVPTGTEKLFSAISNYNFPTAAAVVDESITVPTPAPGVPGPSTAVVSKLTLTAHTPRGGMSQRQIKQVQSIMSRTSVKRSVEVTVDVEGPREKTSCWGRLCHWEQHIRQSRPMYRDDAFFDGKVENLPVYQKSMMDTGEVKTGLEYQMAVSRAVTKVDLHERRGVFTTAARRILATMMDPKLLKRRSFLMFATSGFLIYLGHQVPYIFLQERNKEAGIAEQHCNMFISVLAFSNAVGRLALGALACKLNPLKLFTWTCLSSGLSTIVSPLSSNVYFQYGYCCIFGFCMASVACLRSMVLVELYGLEKLTNATGMMLLFQGFGCMLCTPLASVIKQFFGLGPTFHMAGLFIFSSGCCLMTIKYFCDKEVQLETQNVQEAAPPSRAKKGSKN